MWWRMEATIWLSSFLTKMRKQWWQSSSLRALSGSGCPFDNVVYIRCNNSTVWKSLWYLSWIHHNKALSGSGADIVDHALIYLTTDGFRHSDDNVVQKWFLWVCWCSYKRWFCSFYFSTYIFYIGDVSHVTRAGFPYVLLPSLYYDIIGWQTQAFYMYFCSLFPLP